MALPLPLLRSRSRWLVRLTLAGLCSCATADPLPVTVVLSEQSAVYQKVFATLQAKLGGSNIKLTASNGRESTEGAILIVAVGVRAADVLPPTTKAPVLYVLLPKSRYDTLSKLRQPSGANARQSIVYLEQPVKRQLRLVAAALPRRDRVGILSSAATRSELDQLSREAPGHKLKVHAAEVNEQLHLSDALQGVLENCDVLLALPDTSIYNSTTIRNMLLSSYHSGKPLVGYSAGLVNAGAVAAVFTTPEQFGAQAAAMIERFVRTGILPPPQYPQRFEVAVNKAVATSLGLAMKDANAIEQEMESQEHAAP